MRFLDRFVYRNPKTTDKKARKGDKNVFRRKAYDPLGVKKLAVTSAVSALRPSYFFTKTNGETTVNNY